MPPSEVLALIFVAPAAGAGSGRHDRGAARRFLNVRSDDDFMLVVAWLVAALRERGPYPVLVLNGEQGTGKSVFSRMIRSLVDPSAAPIRAVPKDDRDLVMSASNSMCSRSIICPVCRHGSPMRSPGSPPEAVSRPACFTQTAKNSFLRARPIMLNGIPTLTDRADLADRAVTIHLAVIRGRATARR